MEKQKSIEGQQKQQAKKCLFCGAPFVPKDPEQEFCSEEDNPSCYHERVYVNKKSKFKVKIRRHKVGRKKKRGEEAVKKL